jgi:TnpA family transposase
MDNMIITFIYHVRGLLEAGKSSANIAFLQHGAQFSVELPKLVRFLKWFPNQGADSDLSIEEFSQEAYKILPKQKFVPIAKFIEGHSFDKKAAKWKFYKQSSRLLSLYLRPILLSVNFEFYKNDSSVMALIQMLKKHYEANKPPSALKFTDDLGLSLPKSIITYLKANPEDKNLDPHLLEFYIYQKMYHHFNRGRLFCNDSVSFGDLDNDLIADKLVDRAEEIAKKYGHSKIPIYCGAHLDDMLKKLDETWDTTLKNIEAGKNKGIKFTEKKDGEIEWRLLYDASPKEQDTFFKTLDPIEISNLVKCIGDRVGIWEVFKHSKDKYIKRKGSSSVLLNAGILAEAFGIGPKMLSEMSDLNYAMLRSTSKDCITVDNLSNANDLVSNYIYSLPIFKSWNLLGDTLLADVDGQKFSTSSQTIQSRYSGKYFGTKKGISLYTLLANFVAVNAKNIGVNEYEGHALYDMVYGNKTEIPIDSVTGDNHSLNQLNFVTLDSIDVAYVPSMKNIKKVSGDLCSLKPPSHYTGFLKPKRQIDVALIKSQKRGILRVLLSLLIQENTQSTIIRKLNSHSRYGRLRAALVEYNNIFKSIHALNMINDMGMRKSMRTARNRTEAYHQFQSLIRKVYRGVFSGKKIIDNRISAHATRLVANCSVAYNATILNGVYERMLKDKLPVEALERFLKISPIAWSHISFTGKYNFKKIDGHVDFEELIIALEKRMKSFGVE